MVKQAVSILGILLVLAGPAFADGLPDPEISRLTMATPTATLMVRPDGGGPPFTQARGPGGGAVDATVTLLLLDTAAFPIAGFPREDLWLIAADGNLTACGLPGLLPDQATGWDGTTTWVDPPRAGGWSAGPVYGVVNGIVLPTAGLDLGLVSADLNGDGSVDLRDAGPFVIDYWAGYAFRSDLNADGVLNLSDLGLFAGAIGAACP